MELFEYDNKYEKVWDDFVESSKNGTIFHTRQFLNYHPKNKFKDSSLLFKHKNKILSVFPAAVVEDGNKKILKSHPGSSYGGIVLPSKSTLKVAINVIDELIDYARDINVDSIEMRIAPRVFQIFPSEEIEYVLKYKRFEIEATELSSAAVLTDDLIIKRFRSDTLRSAKKSKNKGVVIKECDDFESYWPLLCKNLMERHKTSPTHSLSEIKKLVSFFPKRIRLFAAFYNGVIVAGTVVFICNKNAAHTFYIAQDYAYQNIRPINLLFHDLIIQLKSEGFKYLNFGISTEAGGSIINPGLFRFKEGFGGCGVVRRYYSRRIDKDEG